MNPMLLLDPHPERPSHYAGHPVEELAPFKTDRVKGVVWLACLAFSIAVWIAIGWAIASWLL